MAPNTQTNNTSVTQDLGSAEYRSAVYNHISKYAKPVTSQALLDLGLTLALQALYYYVASWTPSPRDNALTFLTVALLGGFLRVRIFIVFHDMAHGSYFGSAFLNKAVGTVMGMLAYTPFSGWQKGHNHHHRHSNKTDRKQHGQTAPWDIEEFIHQPVSHRLIYKLLFSKYTLFTTTPLLYFGIVNRILSLWYENLLFFAYNYALFFVNPNPNLKRVELAVFAVATISGFLLFHIQHTFEGCYRAPSQTYDRFVNGIKGSTHLEVPFPLSFFTARIEYHNIHHLNTKVPLYRLKQCYEDGKHLFQGMCPKVTLLDILRMVPYSLRDDKRNSFLDLSTVSIFADKVAK